MPTDSFSEDLSFFLRGFSVPPTGVGKSAVVAAVSFFPFFLLVFLSSGLSDVVVFSEPVPVLLLSPTADFLFFCFRALSLSAPKSFLVLLKY
jgi:hypothetical protein